MLFRSGNCVIRRFAGACSTRLDETWLAFIQGFFLDLTHLWDARVADFWILVVGFHLLPLTGNLVSVRIRLPEADFGSSTILCDLEIEFAGQTVPYRQVPFQQVTEGIYTRISGTIPATLADFKIPPPSLFTVPVKNEIPVLVETTWRPM